MPVENDPSPELAEYAHPEMLVTTEWLASHLDDPEQELHRGFRPFAAWPARAPAHRRADRQNAAFVRWYANRFGHLRRDAPEGRGFGRTDRRLD